jgi:oxygen-independent coproporphyrinogen-3 oxidase
VIEKIPGLYIHVPFCISKCGYCDFYSETALDLKPLLLDALPKEMRLYQGEFGLFDSLYLGGGTPSILSSMELETILGAVHRFFHISPGSELTLETNPANPDLDYLRSIRSMGFNRLNIGVQSFDDSILTFLGRRHTAQEARAAVCKGRRAGFANIGLDLIYGVPGQSLDRWRDTLGEALTFEPEHLSCYQLTLPKGTTLGKKLLEGSLALPDDEASLKFFLVTAELLDAAGYVHYEVSNYARGMSLASRHNRKYWDHSPYLGLAPARIPFFKTEDGGIITLSMPMWLI